MSGDDRARFCGRCSKHVYNLTAMTRREAEELVVRTEGKLCVRFYRRADGTMLTADCPVGVAALRRPVLLMGALAAAFLIATLGALTAGAFVVPRARDDGRNLPGPIQMVMDWLFPPQVCVMGDPFVPPPDFLPQAPEFVDEIDWLVNREQ
jgi:hypothetical protein